MTHPQFIKLAKMGLMGSLIDSFQWEKTPLGDPADWPQPLLTTLSLMLNNKIPMSILWGPSFIQFYNDAYIPTLGLKHPKALGVSVLENWKEISTESDRILGHVYKGGTFFSENSPFFVDIAGTLEERFYTFSCVPIELENGEVGGVFMTTIDTTDEIKGKKILSQSENSFRNYQERSSLPFLSMSKDWIVDYMNAAAFDISLFAVDKAKGVVGKNFYKLWPAARDTIFDENYKKAMAGEFVEFEACYSDTNTWYRIYAFPLQPGIGIYFQDVTESKKLQIELQNAISARDQFMSMASHELNTPLTSLKLHTQLMERILAKGVSTERLQKFFEQTHFQITRLGHLVGDMLDVSRIRQGKISMNLEVADLKEVIIEGIESYSAYFQAEGLKPPNLEIKGNHFNCQLDVARFDQVISNLLSNSVKYGEGRPVSVTLTEDPDKLILAVKDEGNGISGEDKESIFEQYNRGRRDKGEGLGLGLFIAKQIVTAHNGTITVESIHGSGCTFIVKLPKAS